MTSPDQLLENFKILNTEETVVHKRCKGCLLPAQEQTGKVKMLTLSLNFKHFKRLKAENISFNTLKATHFKHKCTITNLSVNFRHKHACDPMTS
jgi:hypothetical protein